MQKTFMHAYIVVRSLCAVATLLPGVGDCVVELVTMPDEHGAKFSDFTPTLPWPSAFVIRYWYMRNFAYKFATPNGT